MWFFFLSFFAVDSPSDFSPLVEPAGSHKANYAHALMNRLNFLLLL